MRRRVSLFAGLVLLLISSGCTLSQVFLYGLLFEIDFPPGVWTRVTCIEFSSGLRIVAGPYSATGKILKEDDKLKKFKVRYSVLDPEGRTQKHRLNQQYSVEKDGTFKGSSRLKKDFVVPPGSYLCMDMLPKRYAIPLDTIFEFFNCQNDDLLPAADGSPDPGSQH